MPYTVYPNKTVILDGPYNTCNQICITNLNQLNVGNKLITEYCTNLLLKIE